jgi:hypothetical protein
MTGQPKREASAGSSAYPAQTDLLIRFIELAHNFAKYAPTVDWAAQDAAIAEVRTGQWRQRNNENVEVINKLLGHFGGLACKLALGQEEEQLYTLKNFHGFDEQGLMIWQVAQLPPQAGVHLQGSALIKDLRSMHIQDPTA